MVGGRQPVSLGRDCLHVESLSRVYFPFATSRSSQFYIFNYLLSLISKMMQHLHSRGQGQGNGREGICPSPLDFGITYFSYILPLPPRISRID